MATLEGLNHIGDKINYCIEVILKEAKLEDRLVKQIFYTMLSMYTNDPRNLAINSPTGEGKNYIIRKVADLFPKEDVIKYVGMTDKSIFHRSGKLVIKNDTGEYELIDEVLEKLDEDIEDKKNELSKTKDSNTKQGLKSQIKELENENKRLYKDAKKLIDLSHKCIIFLDTPRPELLNAIMSLLSHDEYEVEYEFVDTHNGIKTKTNVLRGWPVVIFAQAVDYSHHKRYSEIQRRFIVSNPRMDQEKYKAAIELIVHKHSVPDFLYQNTVVSDQQKELARYIIRVLKEKIMDISTTTRPGNNNVFIPFEDAITGSLATKKSSDMTTADRILGYLSLLVQVNIEDRPFIIFRKKGNPITQKIPLATFADLKEALSLMQYSNGVRPYISEWYRDVFLQTYNEKQKPDFKTNPDGRLTLEESRIGVTTHQLADATFSKKGKKISAKHIRETYLEHLINQGYIDSVSSHLDRRADIYFPVVDTITDNNEDKTIGDTPDTPFPVQSPIFPSQNYIRSKILALLEYANENTVCEIKNIYHDELGNVDIDGLIEKYYNNPDQVFHEIKNDKEDEKDCDSDNSNNNDNQKRISESCHPIVNPNEAQNEPFLSNGAQKCKINEKKAYSVYPYTSLYSCYYCSDFQTNNDQEYERHVVLMHPARPAYPNGPELKKFGFKPQGKEWER